MILIYTEKFYFYLPIFLEYIDTSNVMTENSLRFFAVLFIHSVYLIRTYYQITGFLFIMYIQLRIYHYITVL